MNRKCLVIKETVYVVGHIRLKLYSRFQEHNQKNLLSLQGLSTRTLLARLLSVMELRQLWSIILISLFTDPKLQAIFEHFCVKLFFETTLTKQV